MCADGGKHDQRHWLQTTRFTTSRCMFEDKQSYQTVDSRILRRRGNVPFQGLFSLLALMKCAQNNEALDLYNGGRVEFWDTYNALKLKTKAKKEKQERQKKPISLPLVPSRQAGLLVLHLRVCCRCLLALGVTERGTHACTI